MKIKYLFLKILRVIPDDLFNKVLFLFKVRYYPNFKNPVSLNEKINFIKLHSKNKLRKFVTDRLKVREYVKQKSDQCSLIDILWSGFSISRDIYDQMPNEFVIKANHGSGMVLLVDKNKHTFNEIFTITEKWKETDYALLTRQWVYNKLEKKLIIEEFLYFDSGVPPDYKFFCINGKVELVQVDLNRFQEHKRNLYDKNFVRIDAALMYDQGHNIPKPKLFDDAVSIAEKLSQDFDFIRVDLYILPNAVYFGELTNTPGNGFEPFYPKEFDFEIGKKMKFIKEFSESV
ncbi:MAG: ATP-grasp fold amidoligase family protein [Candidatus Krumholzibacteriota bacterium]|nr:ATP-grasp fold amidoligase family protein [Candidatus Krumholzibacteriota bacterium]